MDAQGTVKTEVEDFIDRAQQTDFTDLYLPEDSPEKGHLWPDRRNIPEAMYGYVQELIRLAKKQDTEDYSIQYEGVVLRGHRLVSVEGTFHIFRKMPSRVWTLEELKMHSAVNAQLMDPRLNGGGLVMICGQPGNGKSTTCAAVIVERLKKFGGLCITVEDPAEMPIHGPHGDNGFCMQTNLSGKDDYAGAIRGAMRGYPSQTQTIMLVGEVRDAETAALVLRSAVDGRLVFATAHAGNVISGLQRILTLASKSMGYGEARELLAASFKMVLHQRLENNRLRVGILVDTQSVAGRILQSEQSLEMLKTDVQQQQNIISLGKKIEVRRK